MGRKKKGIGLMLERFSLKATKATGTSGAFIIALAVLIVWAISGPLFHFSDTWQLVINTGTTIVTFLMVFLIQRTQNKDALAIHLKLNEIVAPSREPVIGWSMSRTSPKTRLRCFTSITKSWLTWPRPTPNLLRLIQSRKSNCGTRSSWVSVVAQDDRR